MNRKTVTAVVAVLFALAIGRPARAGYRIQEVDPEFPEDVTTSYFQEGKARVEGAIEGLVVIVDLKKGEGWLVDKTARRYAGGRIDDLADELRKIEQMHTEDADAGAAEPAAAPVKPHVVEIKSLGAGESLLGYETRRYQVLVDKELLEELWLAPALDVPREIDLAGFSSAMQRMLGGDPMLSQGYEESEAYRTVRAAGYPLRQVLYFVGEKSTLAVTSVGVQDFPAADFTVPGEYAKVGYTQLLMGEDE